MVFLIVVLVLCLDDIFESIFQNLDKDMYFCVNVFCIYVFGVDEIDSKEMVINGIDVLVFVLGIVFQSGLFLKLVFEGILVIGKNMFQVIMFVGEGLEVYVFMNCYEELVCSGVYKGLGMKMDVLLEKMIFKVENNLIGIDCLLMYGFLLGVIVVKELVGKMFSVLVLCFVVVVQVKVDEVYMGNLGELLDSEGKVIFKLCEFYVYFLVDSGRLVLLKEVYEMVVVGLEEEKKICNVVKIILFDKLGVCLIGDKFFLKSEVFVVFVGLFYLYENIYYLDNGFDQFGFVVGNI